MHDFSIQFPIVDFIHSSTLCPSPCTLVNHVSLETLANCFHRFTESCENNLKPFYLSSNHTVQINQYNVHAKIKSDFLQTGRKEITFSPFWDFWYHNIHFALFLFFSSISISYYVLFLNCVLLKQSLPIMLPLLIYLVSLKEETKCVFKEPLRFRITQSSELPNSKHTDLVLTSTASHSPRQPGITG